MAPIIDVSDNILRELDVLKIPYKLRGKSLCKQDPDDFVYIPSTELYVAKHRTLYGKNWSEAHKELQSQGSRMMTVPEFVDFLRYLKEHDEGIYKDIARERSTWRAEWLDANFKFIDRKLYVNSNHIHKNGKLVSEDSKLLDKHILMEDKLPGISLESWLIDGGHTKQGFPTENVKLGGLYYQYPRKDAVPVVMFEADSGSYLSCGRNPFDSLPMIGVRAVRQVLQES